MANQNEKVIRYVPEGGSDNTATLAEGFRHRHGVRRPAPPVRKPDYAPPDRTSWFGGRHYSPRAQRHNAQLDEVDYAAVEAEYAVSRGLELEFVTLREADGTVSAEADLLRQHPPDSLEAVVVEHLVQQSIERVLGLVGDGNEAYRRRALG